MELIGHLFGFAISFYSWLPKNFLELDARLNFASSPLHSRYTTFIALYPIGVTGELLCQWAALPVIARTGAYSVAMPNAWNAIFNFYGVLIAIMLSYIPIFPQLYLHMFAQRRKVIGGKGKKE